MKVVDELQEVVPQPRQPQNDHQVEPVDDSGQAVTSYADETARRRFVDAMIARPPSPTVTVYLAAPQPQVSRSRLKRLRAVLPSGARLLTYTAAIGVDRRNDMPGSPPDVEGHLTWWETFNTGLDGLIVHGTRQNGKGRIFRLGPFARLEMVSMIKLGRPVLLDAHEYGLVPVVDCAPRRFGPPHKLPRLALRVPPAWDPAANTLAAAMRALTPLDR